MTQSRFKGDVSPQQRVIPGEITWFQIATLQDMDARGCPQTINDPTFRCLTICLWGVAGIMHIKDNIPHMELLKHRCDRVMEYGFVDIATHHNIISHLNPFSKFLREVFNERPAGISIVIMVLQIFLVLCIHRHLALLVDARLVNTCLLYTSPSPRDS